MTATPEATAPMEAVQPCPLMWTVYGHGHTHVCLYAAAWGREHIHRCYCGAGLDRSREEQA